MRKFYLLIAGFVLTASAFAQAPQKMSYQAVIRNSSNALLGNTSVGMKISILQGSGTGAVVFSETHTPTTDINGLVSLEIGAGTLVLPSGPFSDINWATGPYFLKMETDPTGGSNYTIVGTNQLLSVPYALFSASVSEKTYTIGLWPELGGYVFRLSSDGKHGVVAETQDVPSSLEWFTAQDFVNDPANHSLDGKKFMDWRLPTKSELYDMYMINATIGGFINTNYWTGTERDNLTAYYMIFPSGFQGTSAKTNQLVIHPVRVF